MPGEPAPLETIVARAGGRGELPDESINERLAESAVRLPAWGGERAGTPRPQRLAESSTED